MLPSDFVLWMFPVDVPTTTGTGNSERQEAASTAASEEAGQAYILTVTWRDLMLDILAPWVQVTRDRKLECNCKVISRAELLQALSDATLIIQENAILYCKLRKHEF